MITSGAEMLRNAHYIATGRNKLCLFSVNSFRFNSTLKPVLQDKEFIKFQRESQIKLRSELQKSIDQFDSVHSDRFELLQKFPPVLSQWGWKLVKAPFLKTGDDHIHLSKVDSKNLVSVDILLDYRIPENDELKEMQMIINRGSDKCLYLIGTLSRKYGFTSGSCMIINADQKDLILENDFKTFSQIGNKFYKMMEIDADELNQLKWILKDVIKNNQMGDLNGVREKFDVLLYDYISKETGLINIADLEMNEPLVNVLWMLASYSELESRRMWLEDFRDIIGL